MSSGVNAAVRAPALAERKHRLRRGRTRILAVSDLAMLALAYATSYLIADRIAPLPPVSGDAWFLGCRRGDGAVRLARRLHRATTSTTTTASRSRSRASTRCATSSTRCSSGRSAISSSRRASTTSSAGGSTPRPRRFIFLAVALVLIPVARGSIRSWVVPAGDDAAADADRRHRQRGAARLPQDHGAPRVRPRGRRLPQRRGRGRRGLARAGDRLGLPRWRRSSTRTRSTGS